ncbi:hypothetical protein KC19_VG164000, partial [Ceratodon purpureus]
MMNNKLSTNKIIIDDFSSTATTRSSCRGSPPSQVVLKDYTWERGPRLRMTILLFSRNGTSFEQPEFDRLYTNFSQWDLPDSARFGPWELLSFDPRSLAGM